MHLAKTSVWNNISSSILFLQKYTNTFRDIDEEQNMKHDKSKSQESSGIEST